MSPNVLKTYTKKNIDLNDFVLFCIVDRQLSKVTTKGYRYRILRFLETVNKDSVKITKSVLRQYLRIIQNSYIKWQYTYADTLRAFKIYFRDYLNKGDLVDSFRFPKIPFYPKRVPSNEEVKMFYKSIGGIQGRTMYLLFASSGLRRSELLSLHDGNIDVERNMVTSRIHSGSTKNSWCTFFNKECKDALMEYLEIRNHNRSKLFPWNSRKYGKVFWKEAREITGLEITLQTLRDWFCVAMGELGVQDRYIDTFCGRVPKSVLARHYTDYSPNRLKRIYDNANLKILS